MTNQFARAMLWKGRLLRIHVVNPNTSRSMTLKIGAAAKAASRSGAAGTNTGGAWSVCLSREL
jgi:hypothetical protein